MNDEIITIKITGLAHGLGDYGCLYETARDFTGSTITFVGTKSSILRDARRARTAKEREARSQGLKGRNYVSSPFIAIERRVQAAVSK